MSSLSRVLGALFVSLLLVVPSYAAEQLKVGLAAIDVTPPIGVPLGGYGTPSRRLSPMDWKGKYKYAFMLKPSTGKRDAIRAKAMVLIKGSEKLLFLSIDLVAIDKGFKKYVYKKLKKLGFKKENIIVSATHTHHGPGTLSKKFLWKVIGMDLYQRKITKRLKQQTVEVAKMAISKAEPATLHSLKFDAEGIQENRRHVEGHFDTEMNFLMAKDQNGDWMGGMTNLAIHPTSMRSKDLRYSADIPGEIERSFRQKLEGVNKTKRAVTMMFTNGAEGDVRAVHGGERWMTQLAGTLGQQFITKLDKAVQIKPVWKAVTKKVFLGLPYLNLPTCAADMGAKGFGKFIMNTIRKFPLATALPMWTDLTLVQLDGISMMTWPGEPTTSIGLDLKRAAYQAGAKNAWVLGLTNHHLAYFVTAQEFYEPGYEGCASFYGPLGGVKIINKYRKMINKK